MFFSMFKYSFKRLLRNRVIAFWLIFWPIILATLFHFAFSNILSEEKFDNIDIAIVNAANNQDFVDILKDTGMYNISEQSLDKAKEMLLNKEITGYITVGDEITATVNQSGINESIIKMTLDKYEQATSSYTELITANPEIVQSDFLTKFDFSHDYLGSQNQDKNNLNVVVIYFYTVIAMAALCGGSRGAEDISSIQADQSDVGARTAVSPAKKSVMFFASVCASITTTFISVLLVVFYLMFALKVEFGNLFGHTVLLCFVSSVTSVFLGTMIGALVKKKLHFKIGLVIAITMIGCFFSGMMVLDIKYLVQEKAPLISYINPANLITDGLYSLYYYGVGERYYINIAILSAMAVIFSAVTILVIRRQKYEHI